MPPRPMRAWFGLSLLLLACPAPPPLPDAGPTCTVVAPETCTRPELRFADVQPTFQTHCVNCHYGQAGGPWPLSSYSDIADWSDVVRADLVTCSMPLADGGTNMTDAERLLILDWLRCGSPQ